MKTNAKQLAAARRAMEVIAVREGISVEEVRNKKAKENANIPRYGKITYNHSSE